MLAPSQQTTANIYYDLAITCYYLGLKEEGFLACEKVLFCPGVEYSKRNSTTNNEQFYMKPLKMAKRLELKNGIPVQQEKLIVPDSYTVTSPSIIKTEAGYRICLRTVDYKIKEDGSYICRTGNNVCTINYLINTDEKLNLLNCVELKDKSGQQLYERNIHGIEDVRLFGENDFFCSYPEISEDKMIKVCHGKYGDEGSVVNIKVLCVPEKLQCEKNWAPFITEGEIHFIYGYSPLKIYKFTESGPILVKTYEQEELCAAGLRGSACPIPYKNGWLCTVHFVYFGSPRKYFHRFVWLSTDFNNVKIGKPFYFEKIGIEFNLSICDSGEDILIGYSVNDATSIISSVEYETIDLMLKHLEFLNLYYLFSLVVHLKLDTINYGI